MTFYQKCIPHAYRASIFDIDYDELQKQGISALFFDLDNTIIGYDEAKLQKEHVELIQKLQKTFKIVILSNTNFKRVSIALTDLDVPYIWYATKPLKRGFKKALKMIGVAKEKVMMIGDQLMTDVFGSNRVGLKAILVKSVKRKSDRKITKFNRKIENFVIGKIQKKYPELYDERLKQYVRDHTL